MVEHKFDIGDTIINVYNNSPFENNSLNGRRRGFITKIGYDCGGYYMYDDPFNDLISPHYFYNSNIYERFGFSNNHFLTCRLILIEKTEKFWR